MTGLNASVSEISWVLNAYNVAQAVLFLTLGRLAERFGQRLIYGGHIISLARSLSFNGLANAFKIAAINGGRHIAPTFAGDTVYAWSEVLSKIALPGRNDLGALRLRTVATKDRACADFPFSDGEGKFDPAVVLDFDYTVLIPRRAA